jgi:hypothetical protein
MCSYYLNFFILNLCFTFEYPVIFFTMFRLLLLLNCAFSFLKYSETTK